MFVSYQLGAVGILDHPPQAESDMVGPFNSAILSILPALRDMYLWAQKQEPVWPQAGVKCSHRVHVSDMREI